MTRKADVNTRLKKSQILDSCFDFCGPIDAVILRLQEVIARHPNYSELEVVQEYHGYDGGSHYNIEGKRQETDAEFGQRMAREMKAVVKEKEAAAKREAAERKEFERLQKKYGNT
jgi:hypothetical protein